MEEILNVKINNFRYEDSDVILKNINLSIKQGEIIVLTGLSGCGKTTLTRCRRQVDFYTFCSFPFYTSAEKMLFRFFIR
ncbi:ATP-binding cassette domain-containing protein [Bacillus sp. Hm123]|uniref:ATP-binding cassette domain-containing protein n=1 Tax=Bacillus sp. Hm123 TaxID=3450745 RepID=UPI003F443096